MTIKKATKTAKPAEGNADQKQKALEAVIRQLDKDYGAGTVMRLGDQHQEARVDVLPTGILELDLALGVGGLPRGRIVEIYGPESTGKTTVALHAIAQTQQNGGLCAFIDAEHALDPVYARALGVDIENLYVSQPSSGEEALEIAESLGRSGAIDLIVVDSVSALVPRAEIDGVMGESHVGLQARLMSQAMRKLAPTMSKTNTTIIFINQLRLKVGIIYGNPEVTSGGNALKYYASVRLDVRKAEAIKKGDETLGARTKIKVAKNKVAPPLRVAVADMYFGVGMDRLSSILNVGVELAVITKSGTWLSYGDTRLGQGRENARQFLVENPDIADEITAKVYQAMRGESEEPSEEAAPEETGADMAITPLEAAAAENE